MSKGKSSWISELLVVDGVAGRRRRLNLLVKRFFF